MKVFVSAQLTEIRRVRELYKSLRELDLLVTHDWTRTDNLVGGYGNNQTEAGRRAKLDIDGVMSCDRYVILTDNTKCGKGMYVELGAALAQAEIRPDYQVLLVGARKYESIFYYHPKVHYFSNDDELISFLAQDSLQRVAV